VAAGGGPWGWHRLDSRWCERLVRSAGVARGDLVLDIGAGDGALTQRLVDHGAKVVAFELHPGRAAALRHRFDRAPVVVVRADASDLRLPRRPFKVVANLPFAVTTSVLRRITSGGSRLETASLVVPRWAAARWSSGRGGNSAAAACGRRFDFRHGPVVPAHAFTPHPPADAAVLLISRR